MAWYYGTYTCGHDGRTNVIGPIKNRQWIADRYFEKMCEECWQQHSKEQREKINKETAEKALEMELPELQGTPKQVAWANTLRHTLIEDAEKRIEKHQERGKLERVEKIRNQLHYVLSQKNNASWYIDNRNLHVEDVLETVRQEMFLTEESKHIEVLEAIQELEYIKRESTVYPEHAITNAVVEI
jgi:hypothetical protein